MNRRIPLRAAACALAVSAIALAGCGGGGGDSTPAVHTVNVAAFAHNRLHAAGQWTLQGTAMIANANVSLRLVLTLTPGAAAAFPLTGVAGNTTSMAMALTNLSSNASTSTSEIDFFDSADHVFGAQDSDGSCAVVTANIAALPTAAAIGASGALLTSSTYNTCSPPLPASTVSTATATWSVETESGIVLVCENTTEIDGSTTLTAAQCIESDADGNLGAHARVTISDGSTTFTARNY